MVDKDDDNAARLSEFIQRSKMDQDEDNYVKPSNVQITKYNIVLFGWEAKCQKCNAIHYINTISGNGKHLGIKTCRRIQMDLMEVYLQQMILFVGINGTIMILIRSSRRRKNPVERLSMD